MPVALVALLLAGWLTGNLRRVPAGSQALVWRGPHIVGVQAAGWVFGLPWPFGNILLLPAATRSLAVDDSDGVLSLAGGGNAVHLAAVLQWRVTDPLAYYPAAIVVPSLLRTLFAAVAVKVAGRTGLAEVMGGGDATPGANSGAAVCRLMVDGINARLASLAASGAPAGIAIAGITLSPRSPSNDDPGLEAVPAAIRGAGEATEAARADASQRLQHAAMTRDRILTAAHAGAAEEVAAAGGRTATILALEGHTGRQARPGLMEQLYRERIGAILARAGSVTTVDGKAVSHLILPGGQ